MSSPEGGATPPSPWRVRRVVVAMDTVTRQAAALERAAALAEALRSELTTLFVEDTDVVKLAEHHTVYAVGMLGGGALAPNALKDMLRLQAATMRRAVEQAAARRQLKWAFQVRQGRLLADVLRDAGEDDLVVFVWPGNDRSAWPGAAWSSAAPPAAIAQALGEARVRSVLLLNPRMPSGPVLLDVAGCDGVPHALALASQLARLEHAGIDVVIRTLRPEEAERCSAKITAALADAPPRTLSFLHVPGAGLEGLGEIALRRGTAFVVIGAEPALAAGTALRQLLQRVPSSVLLVR